jgi:hypothetical protein
MLWFLKKFQVFSNLLRDSAEELRQNFWLLILNSSLKDSMYITDLQEKLYPEDIIIAQTLMLGLFDF